MRKVIGVITVLTAFVAWILITTAIASNATPSSTPPNVTTSPVCWSNHWDHSDSEALGSPIVQSQYAADGLHIAVTGPTQKQSGYRQLTVPVKLNTIVQGDTQLMYQLNTGYAPAYQMTTIDDPANPATWTGNLVYEDGKWWATRPLSWPLVPTAAMGLGGAPLSAYTTAYPNRFVYQVGFSLGSGAAASDGVVKTLTFQRIMWKFTDKCRVITTPAPTRPSLPNPTEPTRPTWQTPPVTTSTTTVTSSPTGTTTTRTTATATRQTSTTRAVVQANRDGSSNRPTTNLAQTGPSSLIPLVVLTGVLLAVGGALLYVVRWTRTRG